MPCSDGGHEEHGFCGTSTGEAIEAVPEVNPRGGKPNLPGMVVSIENGCDGQIQLVWDQEKGAGASLELVASGIELE